MGEDLRNRPTRDHRRGRSLDRTVRRGQGHRHRQGLFLAGGRHRVRGDDHVFAALRRTGPRPGCQGAGRSPEDRTRGDRADLRQGP